MAHLATIILYPFVSITLLAHYRVGRPVQSNENGHVGHAAHTDHFAVRDLVVQSDGRAALVRFDVSPSRAK